VSTNATVHTGVTEARLQRVPTGPQVDVTDPALLTEDQYAAVARTTCGYRPTEYGNAQRLAVLFGEDVRWVPEERTWYVWNGRHWHPDATGELMRRAKTVARLLWHELPHVDHADRAPWVTHARKSESRQGLRAMIDLAASEKILSEREQAFTLTCTADDFDQNRSLLNCTNGTLNLTTGVLRDHRRDDMQRRITLVPFAADARSSDWERFLLESTGGDVELVGYLQLLAGATLLGHNRHDVLPVIFGPPGSGKSTFIQALIAPLGRQFADTASLETFSERRATSAARDDLARLEGLRLVACVEGERNHTLAAGLVKQITGGDTVAARRLYRSTRTWTPEFTLWIAVNERPRLHRDEEGMYRRIKAIPFENQVVDMDPTLRERLSDTQVTGPAVLAWAVAGAVRLAAWEGPLRDPQVVLEATEEYRDEQAPTDLVAWLEECCQTAGDDVKTPTQELRLSYEQWCDRSGRSPDSVRGWGTDMGRAFKRARTGSTRFYRGVQLLEDGSAVESSTP
jgi:putative DNA primase/helicase